VGKNVISIKIKNKKKECFVHNEYSSL